MAATDLVTFEVVEAETDLQIGALRECATPARQAVKRLRGELEGYLAAHPDFLRSFVPVQVEDSAPEIVQAMARAAEAAGVGPMAAVAGAIAQRVALELLPCSAEVIVENGGDIYLAGQTDRRVLLVAGSSPISGRIAIALSKDDLPVAVCTSSGKVGHSVSFGKAHAATVIAGDGALADAVATGLGNRVQGPGDIERALAYAKSVPGVRGAVVVVEDRVGVVGDVKLVPSAVQATGQTGDGRGADGQHR